jgi:hypothetical protein
MFKSFYFKGRFFIVVISEIYFLGKLLGIWSAGDKSKKQKIKILYHGLRDVGL